MWSIDVVRFSSQSRTFTCQTWQSGENSPNRTTRIEESTDRGANLHPAKPSTCREKARDRSQQKPLKALCVTCCVPRKLHNFCQSHSEPTDDAIRGTETVNSAPKSSSGRRLPYLEVVGARFAVFCVGLTGYRWLTWRTIAMARWLA